MGWHMMQKAFSDGNPRFYHTYPDEGEHRRMGSVAKSVRAGARWCVSLLEKVLPARK